jgi:hypothetical protein
VSLTSPARTKTYHYEVVRFSSLTPLITAIGLAELIYASQGSYEELTLESRMTVHAEDTIRLVVEHSYSGEAPFDPLFRSAIAELGALYVNRFRELRVDSVSFEVRLAPGRNLLVIEEARAARSRVRPGEKLGISVVLRDQDNDRTRRDFEVKIPRTVPAGQLGLVVTSADSLLAYESMRLPGFNEPSTLDGLLRRLERSGGENRLVVAGYTQQPGVIIGDRELPAPPPSLNAVLARPAGEETPWTTAGSMVFRSEWTMPAALAGIVEIQLEVVR